MGICIISSSHKSIQEKMNGKKTRKLRKEALNGTVGQSPKVTKIVYKDLKEMYQKRIIK